MQRKLQHAFAIATLGSVALAGTAFAEGDHSKTPNPEPQTSQGSAHSSDRSAHNDYSKLDNNRDGALTEAEASKNSELVAQWQVLDTNHDGELDQAEFSKFEAASAKEPKPAMP